MLRNRTDYRSNHDVLKSIHEQLFQDIDNFNSYIINLIIKNLENPLSGEQRKQLYDKIDIYSIGISFIYFISNMNELSNFRDAYVLEIFNHPKIHPFIELAKKMLILDYTERISAEEAYTEYCDILSRFKPKKTKRTPKPRKPRRKSRKRQ